MQTMNGIGSAITFWHQGREAGGVIASQRQNLSPDAFVAFQPCRAHAGPATRLPGRECRRRVVVVVVVVVLFTYARSGRRDVWRTDDFGTTVRTEKLEKTSNGHSHREHEPCIVTG